MGLKLELPGFAALFGQAGMAQVLALLAGALCVGLTVAMIVQSRRHAAVKRELSAAAGGAVEANPAPGLALDGIALSPIDRVFPRRPGQFLLLVCTISIGTWVAGYLLAPNPQHFLTSSEWLFQPFYVAAHLIALRLFINVYTRNYATGISHLDVSRRQALRGIRPILGPSGALAAVLIALPFCYFDFRYLFSERYARMGRDEIVRAIDYLMWSIWSLEWFINAFIWVLLVGFMIKNCLTIGRFPFRSPISVVLHDKQYKPFLQMSAQGATVVLGFSFVTVLYLFFTGGELTDYLGLGITIALLFVCFVPPWLVLRGKVDTAVRAETLSLRHGAGIVVGAPMAGGAGFSPTGDGSASPPDRSLEARVDEALALLRIWHLQNLYGNLGQTEARAIAFRLMAPAATIGWQVANNFGDMSKRVAVMFGALVGK